MLFRSNEIVAAVKRVTDIMAEIAAASDEQSAGIEQVNQAITQMDDVTQQNAALVEQAAAAAEAMQGQAEALMGRVSIFKLETAQAALPTAATDPARSAIPRQSLRVVAPSRKRPGMALAKQANDGDWKEF